MKSLRLLVLPCLFALACSSKSETPAVVADSGELDVGTIDTSVPDTAKPSDAGADVPAVDPLLGCTKDPGIGDAGVGPVVDGGDPTGGADKFTMAQAMAGFPDGAGVLTAVITTQKGKIVCRLDEAKAPISVANFVGLARGTRPYLDGAEWKTKKFYDGLKWHRVISGFVIQGGDPLGNGSGGPGYSLPNENHTSQSEGVISMAASTDKDSTGKTIYIPSGSQFYIVIGTGPAPNYNVFGKCDTEVAMAIGDVETNSADRPKVPINMQTIEIARCPK